MISGFELLLTSGREGLLVAPPDEPAPSPPRSGTCSTPRPSCSRMGAEGRVTATTRYSWNSVAAELEAYYLELRGELPRARAARRAAGTRTRHPRPSDTMPGVGRLASSWLPPLAWMAIIFAFSALHGGGHLPAAEVRAAQARARRPGTSC